MARSAHPTATISMLVLTASILPLCFASATSTPASLAFLFPPRPSPPASLVPRPPVCDMAHVTILHIGDANTSYSHLLAHELQGAASSRYFLLLHLPSFDLSAVATVQIMFDGNAVTPPFPPFNNGNPLLVGASGLRQGAVASAPLFVEV
jgi:hypothetical protein